MIDDDFDEVRTRLALLEIEHRDLDDVISRMVQDPAMDALRMQRLKKRKLALKDQISALENLLIPDIIA